MKVLVTGGSRLIGGAALDFDRQGREVTGFDKKMRMDISDRPPICTGNALGSGWRLGPYATSNGTSKNATASWRSSAQSASMWLSTVRPNPPMTGLAILR